MAKKFFILTAISLIVFLCVCWSLYFNSYNAIWIETVAYFGLTYWCFQKLNKDFKLSAGAVATAIGLGRIIVEIPIRVADWSESVGSLVFTIACLVAIGLGTICYRYNKTVVFLISFIVLILVNTFGLSLFNNMDICK